MFQMLKNNLDSYESAQENVENKSKINIKEKLTYKALVGNL